MNAKIAVTRIVSAAAIAVCLSALGASAENHLNIQWPEHWEYAPAQTRGSAMHLRARQQESGKIQQTLSVTVVDISASKRPIDAESIEGLTQKLRDAALTTAKEKEIAIQSLSSGSGFYFVATDKRIIDRSRDEFLQMIEGVMLNSGYLVTFTLLTDDAHSAPAKAMLAALDHLIIE